MSPSTSSYLRGVSIGLETVAGEVEALQRALDEAASVDGARIRQRDELLERCFAWFDDIEDDARILRTHADPKLHGMIDGILAVASTAKSVLKPSPAR